MARTKRTVGSRTQFPVQENSRFLSLPREVRNIIYHFALTKPSPIDLCPPNLLTAEQRQSIASVNARLTKANGNKAIMNWESSGRVRHGTDLEYVRKQMATGLLATCTQCWDEGWPFFWKHNVFRFSCDSRWITLRRFLTSVGARVRSQLGHLEVFPPYEDWDYPQRALMYPADGDGTAVLQTAKNHPTLRMAKLMCKRPDLTENITFLNELWARERPNTPRDLRFLLPAEWVVSQRAWLHLSRERLLDYGATGTLFFERFNNVDWLVKTVLVQKGAQLLGSDMINLMHKDNIDIICEKGSFAPTEGTPRGLDQCTEITKLTILSHSPSVEEYLPSLEGLFCFDQVVSPARGGKATSRQPRLARQLRAFGGCRFESYQGWVCMYCGSKPKRQQKNPLDYALYPRSQACYRAEPPTNGYGRQDCVFSYMDGIFLKKHARAHSKGEVPGPHRNWLINNP